jgi:uncharacterized protein YkwD
MFGIKGSRWFALCVFMTVCASPTGAVAAGPVPEPPTCITVLPAITTECPSPSQPQTSHVASAESGRSSQARAFSVTATPSLARSLVAEVNRIRHAHHLRPLASSARLSRAATEHATALATAGVFTHSWPTTGRLFSSWIRTFYPPQGYRTWMAGENLLWSSPGFTSADAVQQWLDSPTHRRVMLTSSWRELGIGVVSAVGAPGAYGGRDVQIAAAEFGLRRP